MMARCARLAMRATSTSTAAPTEASSIQNNLFTHSQGRTEICGLGTGGNSRSNITIRHNTWVAGGLAYHGFPGFEWDCDSGRGNVIARNIAVDRDGGFAQDGSRRAARFARNIWGRRARVRLDRRGNCVSRNCNPRRRGRIGYRNLRACAGNCNTSSLTPRGARSSARRMAAGPVARREGQPQRHVVVHVLPARIPVANRSAPRRRPIKGYVVIEPAPLGGTPLHPDVGAAGGGTEDVVVDLVLRASRIAGIVAEQTPIWEPTTVLARKVRPADWKIWQL